METDSETTQQEQLSGGTNKLTPSNGKEIQSKPAIGKRQALSNLRRQLTDDELASPGVQKLILDMLEEAEEEKDGMKSYVTRYYEAEKNVSVLSERLNSERSVEVFFGVGVGLGGAIIGLVPFFWVYNNLYGVITGAVGLCITIGATLGRIIKK